MAELPPTYLRVHTTPPTSTLTTPQTSTLTTPSPPHTETSSYDSDYELPTLGTSDLLSILLSPHLHLTLTPVSLLLADNPALFRLLPLVLTALARVGSRGDSRELFKQLVDVLRMRLCACRGLKLRFMLLVRTAGYGDLWGVKLVHRAGCYVVARAALEVRQHSLEIENGTVVDTASSVSGKSDAASSSRLITGQEVEDMKKRVSCRLFEKLMNDKGELVKFAMTELFDKVNGVKLKDHRTKWRKIRDSFRAYEIVDWLVERTGVMDREKIAQIGERLRLEGLITRTGNQKRFEDDRHLYTSDVTLLQNDSSCAKVQTSQGQILHCWTQLGEGYAVKSVDLKLPVDAIDLQSIDFWSRSVFDNTKKEGDRFGFRLVAHPLMCQGMNLQQMLEPAAAQPMIGNDALATASHNLIATSQTLANSVTHDLARIAVGQTAKTGLPPQMTPAITSTAVAHSLTSIANDSNVATDTYDSNTDWDSISLSSAGVGGWEGGIIISSTKILKVFSSIARPMILSLRRMIPEGDIDDDDHYEVIKPNVLVKEGDNLLQDLSTEVMFRAFNNIWSRSTNIFPDKHQAPFILCYEVMPTDATKGFMEVVSGLTSLTDFDWERWKQQFARDPVVIDNILRSAAGSYIGAYVVGARDRHFDNIVIQDNRTVTHIDFGFVLGTSPPIDGPRFSIAPGMESVFKDLGVWKKFVSLCVKAFQALRKSAPAVVRTATMLYSRAGHEEETVKEYLRGKNSLNVRESTPKALQIVKKQIESSSTDWKSKFKSYSHQKIDPVFYGLLAKRFPPAVLAMKIVDRLDHKASEKLQQMSSDNRAHISAEEKLEL